VVVGTCSTSTSTVANTACVWDTAHGFQTLQSILASDGINISGWTLETAAGVSADGRTIVGWGTDPSGLTEAWVATIPEPTTGLLVMAGVLGLAIMRRKEA
jgi:hypothetical protein